MIKIKSKDKKGITLIALIITIIVLLILAGVTVTALTGEKSTIKEAKDAKSAAEQQSAKEKVQAAVLGATKKDGTIDLDILNNKLRTSIENLPEIVYIDENQIYIGPGGDIIGLWEQPNDTVNEGQPAIQGNKKYESNGKTAIIPEDFKVSDNSGENSIDNGLVVIAPDKSEFVWIPVSSESEYVRNTSYSYTGRFGTTETGNDDTDYLPDGVTDEKQTVMNAGGFYIARYEAGKNSESKVVSKKGATVWNNINSSNAKEISKGYINNSNVKSALCSGTQWDVTMGFIDGKSDGTGEKYYANYVSSSRHTGSLAKTGQNNADKVCNIYDLEGNAIEWDAEHDDYGYVISRGGEYTKTETPYHYQKPASGRSGIYEGTLSPTTSFRMVLYVIE